MALGAARLLYRGVHREYLPAKREAARRQGTRSLPANRQVHDLLLAVGRRVEGEAHGERLNRLRAVAVRWMQRLEPFQPRLVGSVWSGRIRPDSDIDLHLHHSDPEAPRDWLPESARFEQVGEFFHWRFEDEANMEFTVYPSAERQFWCDFSQAPMARADLATVKASLAQPQPSRLPEEGPAVALMRARLTRLEGAAARHFGPVRRHRLVRAAAGELAIELAPLRALSAEPDPVELFRAFRQLGEELPEAVMLWRSLDPAREHLADQLLEEFFACGPLAFASLPVSPAEVGGAETYEQLLEAYVAGEFESREEALELAYRLTSL